MPLTPSLIYGCAVTALGALLLLPPSAFAAHCPPASVPPSAEYLNLVTRYASGEHAQAVFALGVGNMEKLRCDLDNLQAAAVAVNRCRGKCEDQFVFQRFSIKAALLLHAHREIMDEFGTPVSEQFVRCGTGPQAQVVERLAGMLTLVDPEAKAFLRRFYLGMTRRAHWSHCIAEAERWARTGLKRLPKDATLLMTLGIALDTTAFLTLAPAPRSAIMGPQAIRQAEAQTDRLNTLWARVRRTYEEALAESPGLHEARLRLGRVLWRVNRPEPARACFQEVLSRSDDQVLLYLAHLFLGRILEDEDRLAEAEKEYQAALDIRPFSESAAVGLSHLRLRLGDPEGARVALNVGLEALRLRSEVDPLKVYPMAHAREGQTMLDELRRELIP